MRYFTTATLVLGVILTASAIVAMRPTVYADPRAFSGPSWDVYAPVRISLLHVGALVSGLVLIGVAVVKLRSRRDTR